MRWCSLKDTSVSLFFAGLVNLLLPPTSYPSKIYTPDFPPSSLATFGVQESTHGLALHPASSWSRISFTATDVLSQHSFRLSIFILVPSLGTGSHARIVSPSYILFFSMKSNSGVHLPLGTDRLFRFYLILVPKTFPSKIFPKIRRKYCDEDRYSLLRKRHRLLLAGLQHTDSAHPWVIAPNLLRFAARDVYPNLKGTENLL
ncbi:hypothetical protein EV421DRAFT_1924788 [Armillaria borealis]|uniref:Uncharacterized protein n=1 Tax=Armillaria borealis TaxID=47425 RepID=A0AA39IZJ9_9AGAR|nr:hypothetical protein EV421DRAFT_1924788 [Armillaria borealis]